jgi:hypothetical protein
VAEEFQSPFHQAAGRRPSLDEQRSENTMDRFAIKFLDEPANARCPHCDQAGLYKKGPHLFFDAIDEPLCRPCGKRLAPSLQALVDLAQTADKVGRQCRHLLTPSMETMLELSRAAENYTTAPRICAKAG